MNPIQTLLVSLDKAYQDSIVTDSGLTLYLDPSWRPEFNVSVTGKAELVPAKLSKKISKGDEVLFSYRVVADVESKTQDEVFTSMYEGGDGYVRKFISNRGNTIGVHAMKGVISIIWAGFYWDKNGGFQHGVQGTQSQMERWLSQFNFNSEAKFIHRNLFDIDGQDLWAVKPTEVFAKITEDGLIPVGDRLILEPIEVELSAQERIALGNVSNDVKKRFNDRATVVHDYEPLELKKGDVVGFLPIFCEKYEIKGKQYFLIKPRRALCVYYN